jgi:hypothetical protein
MAIVGSIYLRFYFEIEMGTFLPTPTPTTLKFIPTPTPQPC